MSDDFFVRSVGKKDGILKLQKTPEKNIETVKVVGALGGALVGY